MTSRQITLDQALKLAIQHHKQGRVQQAESIYRQILKQHPQHTDALYLLGTLAYQRGYHEEALKLIHKAIKLNPGNPNYYYNLGLVLVEVNRHQDAAQAFKQAIRIKPDYVEAYNNLATAQYFQRLFDAAQENYRKALKFRPNYTEAHSNLLSMLSYNVLCSPQQLLDAHREWDLIHGGAKKAQTFTHKKNGGSDKRLRIGYVSPDFFKHPVSFFFEPILENHDRTQVVIFCYAEVPSPDSHTERLKSLSDHWRSTVGMSHKAVADMIYKDDIDILIDLAGHTHAIYNRLPVFTYKPAPIQATYLGYFATTGLTAMDYWITDKELHPDNTSDLASETFYRLPRCCLIYQPADDAPEITLHHEKNITFASFNDLSKVSPETIALWCEVLHAVPQAHMLVKTNLLADAGIRNEMVQQFAAHGINRQRLTLRQATPSYKEHLSMYNDVDVILDTIPRTGGTMTAEALWMGTPVITLAGMSFVERLSTSMIIAVGIPELVAVHRDDYINIAVSLAHDQKKRNTMKATLRQRMADSPLRDALGLSQALETAYRDMWRRHLKR